MKSKGGMVYLTAAEMAEADRSAIEGSGIDVVLLMENAGAKTADLARSMMGGSVDGSRIVVMAGRGNNGGDGLVAARHLHNWGAEVTIALGAEKGEIRDAPAKQLATAERMGISVVGADAAYTGAGLVIDALLGYGTRGSPREPLAAMIRRANGSGVPILAVDVPSGMDATTGDPGEPCVRARATIAFGFPKTGFLAPGARALVGELFVADISLPRETYAKYSASGMFTRGALARVW